MKAVQVRALAKVNLTLDVIGRRADGYHELRSVFARISLGDDVRVRRSRSWHVAIHPPLDARPDLAERAAHELARRSGRDVAAAITIRKRIPLASGLGGGSSDAAAVLRALGNLWRLDDALLTAVAAKIGSDVPFFFHGAPLAEVGGRGEHVRAVAGGPWWGALALTSGRVSTADAFARLASGAWSDGQRTARLVRALAAGAVDAAALRALCGNDLDAVAVALCPAIVALRERMQPTPLFLSGSGAALFAIADDRGHALALARRMRRADVRASAIQIGLVEAPSARSA
ncbi:MAG: 4-(cytidine 5'-diphospho)-2-C-methyl-D-erythritol kinase [Chloroflexi bacterium]|nr:MAG: 4-(cytidine 5'-diphospho)-2-C-methyl-D-erythritol kinase [Chloroflexota bacterium]